MNNLKHIGIKGQGYFCIVKQYKDEKTGNEFALKELKKEHYPKDEYRYRLNREISILNELQDCENVVKLIDSGHDKNKEKIWYLMPFAEQNLYDFVKNNNNTLTKEVRYNLVEQIINAIKFAHNKTILHRDISPNNVLVYEINGNITLKVADFGLGKDTDTLSFYTGSSASGYGHILYVSPEQRIKLKDATNQSDIYSLGKLVYFIFTGKDPDNLKQFELSTLVTKAIEDNPQDRFNDIAEFESHFLSLKELQLNQKIAIEHLTIKEVVNSTDKIEWLELHQLLVKGNYLEHVYDDYISPVNKLILTKSNLKEYYSIVGNAIKEFVNTYIERLIECYRTVRWPFSSMGTFGTVLIEIIKTIKDDEARLISFKQLWYLAFVEDQWSVQKEIKEVFNSKYISSSIETQIAEYILSTQTKVDMTHFTSQTIPKIIKGAIIKGDELAVKAEVERKAKQNLETNDFEW